MAENLQKWQKVCDALLKPSLKGRGDRRPSPARAVVGEFPAPAGAPSVYRRTSNGDTAMQKKDYAYTGYRYKSVENGRKLRKNMTKEVDREFDAVCRKIDRKVKEAVDSPSEMWR